MTSITRRLALATLGGALAAPAAAQSINIDFGLPPNGPPATYAAAGLPGYWNSIEGEHASIGNPEHVYELLDLNGNPTDAWLHQFGGMELMLADDPLMTGDHAILMEDGLVTHSTTLETCIWIEGLEPGEYEVLMYAIMPNQPTSRAVIRHDFHPPNVTLGGAWPGAHELGLTYARHIITVTSNGEIASHSGMTAFGNPSIGAILNGVQIRQLIFGDLSGDGVIGFEDVVALLAAWGDCPAEGACDADLDDDGSVGFNDLVALLSAWS